MNRTINDNISSEITKFPTMGTTVFAAMDSPRQRKKQEDKDGTQAVANYGSAAAYANELRQWYHASQCWYFCHQLATFHAYACLASLTNPTPRNAPTILPEAIFPLSGRVQRIAQIHRIASFTRRILAEIIDSLFAFIVKLFIVYILVESGFIDLDRYDRLLGDEADLHALIDVTHDLFPVEMLAKVVVSIVEALFITYGLGIVPPGTTPGKSLMGIQVICYFEVSLVAGNFDQANVVRHPHVPFANSLIRALLKNLLINLLFPLSAAAYAFSFNRGIYDIVAKTMVVVI